MNTIKAIMRNNFKAMIMASIAAILMVSCSYAATTPVLTVRCYEQHDSDTSAYSFVNIMLTLNDPKGGTIARSVKVVSPDERIVYCNVPWAQIRSTLSGECSGVSLPMGIDYKVILYTKNGEHVSTIGKTGYWYVPAKTNDYLKHPGACRRENNAVAIIAR